MLDKECWRIVEDARTKLDNTGQFGAFVSRLTEELDTGFCMNRVCGECPVSVARNGTKDVDLTVRETVVSVVSGALLSRLSGSLQDS